MKAQVLKIRIFVLLAAAISTAWAQPRSPVSSSAPRSTVGTGTTPVTAYRSGLVVSPDPIDRTSDLVVTGNVGGGKYFRGVVPYNAMSDFGGSLGSGTLDNFLRYSTVPQNYYSGGVAPFYSQTGTVTRIVPGTNMVIVPPSSKIRVEQDEAIDYRSSFYSRSQENIAARRGSLGPTEMMLPPTGVEQIEPYLLPETENEIQMERVRRRLREEQKSAEERLGEAVEPAEEPERLVLEQGRTTKPSINSESYQPYSRIPQPTAKLATPSEPLSAQEPRGERVDVYDQMVAEYEEVKKAYEEQFGQQEQADVNATGEKPAERKPQYEQPTRITQAPARQKEPPAKKESLSEIEILARSQRVLSERQTFAVYSQDKFNGYMRAAEQYMQQGKYYLAADAYTMATVYKPLDPLGYAGRSHALFAAGEYLSSALYLSRAIEMFSGYVDFRIDIAAMIGDMDTVEKRIADIKACIELSSSPELHFLLAYVYMQLDRLDQAAEAINTAYERMPELPAVGLLKAAIEARRSR